MAGGQVGSTTREQCSKFKAWLCGIPCSAALELATASAATTIVHGEEKSIFYIFTVTPFLIVVALFVKKMFSLDPL